MRDLLLLENSYKGLPFLNADVSRRPDPVNPPLTICT